MKLEPSSSSGTEPNMCELQGVQTLQLRFVTERGVMQSYGTLAGERSRPVLVKADESQ
jgi:hypothetical protein